MAVRPLVLAVLFHAFSACGVQVFAADCKIGKMAELGVTMNGLRPMVTAKINGVDAQFIADSGAFFSLISPAGAAEFKLRTEEAPFHLTLRGVGGSTAASVATVKEFTLAGVPIHNIQFVVGGSDPGGGAVGLLGQNVLRIADVEYDLSNGVIRLMRPHGCDKTLMAYWAKPDQAFSVMDIEWATAASPHTAGFAYVNGAKIRVLFDTGASTSTLSLRAAERAGVKVDGEGVEKAGQWIGIGSHMLQTWIAPFESFRIGDEEIRHTRLRIGAIANLDTDMLIGADFFLSHRIYVASSQRKLFFTYNGGPVFNLKASAATASAVAEPSADNLPDPLKESAPPAGDPSPPAVPAGQPTDAAGFSRRGTAFAARRDFQHAIADLTRACELAPTEPDYFFERGKARLGNQQSALAMDDFDQALKLKPDHVPALVSRATLRLARRRPTAGGAEVDDAEPGDAGAGGAGAGGKRESEAIADLDKASSTVAKEADVREELGQLYARAGAFRPAIAQFDLWLGKHSRDAKAAVALASRCRARGMLGEDLEKALSDCNHAVRADPDAGFFFDSRGLIYLRMRNFDKAIADYDVVLHLQPKNPWALYGRGLAKLGKGMADEGQADIAASKAIAPRVAQNALKHGLAP